jgi:hypothetical protein
MKAIVILLAVVGLVIGGIYLFGGYRSFDPNQQGEQARAAIKPGMNLTQVVKAAGKNPRYQPINRFERKIGGETVIEEQPGTPVDFNYDRVQQYIRDKQLPAGFILVYRFSERTAFAVHFDEAGKVTDVTDAPTMADLLQTR